ncbi:MAG: hypothetical protein GY754_20700 [bacterium]|nr:hypothetical protein [bacterium]
MGMGEAEAGKYFPERVSNRRGTVRRLFVRRGTDIKKIYTYLERFPDRRINIFDRREIFDRRLRK